MARIYQGKEPRLKVGQRVRVIRTGDEGKIISVKGIDTDTSPFSGTPIEPFIYRVAPKGEHARELKRWGIESLQYYPNEIEAIEEV